MAYEISFQLESCIKVATQEPSGLLFHAEVDRVLIEELLRGEWKSQHTIRLTISRAMDDDHAAAIAEQVRDRLVSLFALVTEADVSASDEIMVVNTTTDRQQVFIRYGFRREMKKLRSMTQEFQFHPRIQSCSDLEWSALTRFKKVLMSDSNADALEALLGTIDILGKISFATSAVEPRMKAYLRQRLGMNKHYTKILIRKRHEKVHENVFDYKHSSAVSEAKGKLIKDLSARFGFTVINRIRIEELRLGVTGMQS